jgi:hypothetical protein
MKVKTVKSFLHYEIGSELDINKELMDEFPDTFEEVIEDIAVNEIKKKITRKK